MPRFALLLLTAVLALAAPVSSAAGQASPRIVGGEPIDISQAPYMAAIVDRPTAEEDSIYEAHYCGGAVIHPRAVLTAAHCMEDEVAEDVGIVVGLTDLREEGGRLVPVRAIRTNRHWISQLVHNDISLLILDEDATPEATPAPPASANTGRLTNRQVGIFGWGSRGGQTRGTGDLRGGVQTVLDNGVCKRRWRGETPRWEGFSRFCAIGADDFKPDTCAGDSGGPVVRSAGGRPLIVGVTSYGGAENGCGGPPPGVYTRVSYYWHWINRTLRAAGLRPLTAR